MSMDLLGALQGNPYFSAGAGLYGVGLGLVLARGGARVGLDLTQAPGVVRRVECLWKESLTKSQSEAVLLLWLAEAHVFFWVLLEFVAANWIWLGSGNFDLVSLFRRKPFLNLSMFHLFRQSPFFLLPSLTAKKKTKRVSFDLQLLISTTQENKYSNEILPWVRLDTGFPPPTKPPIDQREEPATAPVACHREAVLPHHGRDDQQGPQLHLAAGLDGPIPGVPPACPAAPPPVAPCPTVRSRRLLFK